MKNLVVLIGNTGDDVKMHHFEGGNCVGRFPLATSSSYTNKQTGEKVTETQWHNCIVRNKAAEVIEKYVKKGDRLYVRGTIKYRKWQDQNGADKYSTEIHVDDFTFLSSKADKQAAGNTAASAAAQTQQSAPPANEEHDDLPF